VTSRISRGERRDRRGAIDDPAVVTDAAAKFLAVRPRSVAETRRRLRHLGYRHDLVDRAVQQLADLGYLDDAAFARAWIESRDRARPRGAVALRRELALKGVDRSVIDEALGERSESLAPGQLTGASPAPPDSSNGASPDSSDTSPDVNDGASPDTSAARRLLERRLPALLREPDPRRRRQKAYALLARNGFDPETCREVAASVPAE
jgi:SOS response regulatory protein OraA/RecX